MKMLVCKKVAIIFVFVLVFLNSCGVGIVGSQTYSGLPSDMPVVYVDPQSISVSPGETFTVSVKIFNLTDTAYMAAETWETGEPLPPPGTRHTYYLGNLYGLDISFSWDPTVLEYVNHTVKIPVETYPDGVLHEDIMDIADEVDEDAGTYLLGKSSMAPAEAFNCRDMNATVFTMTFNVTKEGACCLHLDVDLSSKFEYGAHLEIPHWVLHGEFRSPGARTRIVSVNVGALVAGKLYHPIIIGEDATVRVLVRNDGEASDTYNLTLYKGTVPLETWENEALEPSESKTFNYTIKAEDLSIGLHTLTAEAMIMHEGELFTDEVSKELRVIDTPILSTSEPPSVVHVGDTVTIDASESYHNDQDGEIWNYTWSLIEPGGGTWVYKTYEGVSMTHTFAKNGTWQIILTVRDNWGVEYNPNRPATEPYRKEILLDVEVKPETPFTIENIAFVIIIVAVIILILVYLQRRAR